MDTKQKEIQASVLGQGHYIRPKKKIGFFLLIAPFTIFFILILINYIVQWLFPGNHLVGDVLVSDIASGNILSIIQLILGLIAAISVLGIIIGIPLGLYYISKKEWVNGSYDERSGKGNSSEIPAEIKGWNWGACGLSIIWGVYYSVWISLLCLITPINIIMIFVLGAKGSEWAWRKNKWSSIEQFKVDQNKWKIWGIIFFILIIIVFIINIVGFIFAINAINNQITDNFNQVTEQSQTVSE